MIIKKDTNAYGAAVTICATNYLAKALVLEESFTKVHENFDFYILVMDRKNIALKESYPKINFIWVEDLKIDGFEKIAFTFDIIEFSTNVKPTVLVNLLKKYSIVFYIDPDIYVYKYFKTVINALESNNIALTPHTLTPILDGNNPSDIDFSRFGSFNLGFIGLKSSDETFKFLQWWSDRCLEFGFYEPQSGLAVDQKWIDLAPSFFSGVVILRDLGLNLAFWNLHERKAIKKNQMIYINDEENPLYFFHFSSFDNEKPLKIANKQNRFKYDSREDIRELLLEYSNKLKEKNNEIFSLKKYSFDYFDSGEYISITLRRIYYLLQAEFDDTTPFSSNSGIYNYAKKNKLIGKKIVSEKRENFKDIHKYAKFTIIIAYLLKISLKIFGPQKYYNLMRYIAFISSIRNQQCVFIRKNIK